MLTSSFLEGIYQLEKLDIVPSYLLIIAFVHDGRRRFLERTRSGDFDVEPVQAASMTIRSMYETSNNR